MCAKTHAVCTDGLVIERAVTELIMIRRELVQWMNEYAQGVCARVWVYTLALLLQHRAWALTAAPGRGQRVTCVVSKIQTLSCVT